MLDLVKPDADAPRTLWSTKVGRRFVRVLFTIILTPLFHQITNPQLRERVANLGAGLTRAVGLVPQESNVLLLLNDSVGTLYDITDCGPPF